jgi:hypothetical protein
VLAVRARPVTPTSVKASASGGADLQHDEDEIPEGRRTPQLVSPIVGEFSISSGTDPLMRPVVQRARPQGWMWLWRFRRGDIAGQWVRVHGAAVLGM